HSQGPVALEGQQPAEDVGQWFWRICTTGMGDWKTRSMQSPNARHFLASVCNLASINHLLCFEHRIDTFSRDDDLAFKLEDERRILPVKDNHVNLLTENAIAVHDMSGLGMVSTR